MRFLFERKTLWLFLIVVSIIIIVGVSVLLKYPFGVKQYITIKLGMDAAEKTGDETGWAPPYERVPEGVEFFVYSLGDNSMCIQSDCGIGGYFIECLGGWISGYKDIGEVADYGLRDAGVDINKQKIITVADKNGKIVGIYPGAGIRNLPYIMRAHRNLVSKEVFEGCSILLPSLWK
jgi:hypothetical protein